MLGVELRRQHRRLRAGALDASTPGLRWPIVIIMKTPRASSRVGGDSCGCIMTGANTSTPMLTTVPWKSRRGDADDGQRLAIEVDRLADDVADRRRTRAATSASLSTATGCWPGATSSDGSSVRPSCAPTPSASK